MRRPVTAGRSRGGYRGSNRASSNLLNQSEEMAIEENPEENDDNRRRGRNNGLLSVINNELLEKLKIKPKKEKDKVNKTFLQMKRKRKGKTESDLQNMLNIIYKANAKTVEDIQEALSKGGKFVRNKDTINFLLALANTKVSNQKIQLSANASNIPLYTYQTFVYPNVGIISNDILYLWCIFITSVNRFVDEDTLKIVSSAKFVDVQIVSELFDGNKEIEKGYTQDFTGECCVLNIEKTDKEFIDQLLAPFKEMSKRERKKDLQRFDRIGHNEELNITSYQFDYEGVTYYASADDDSCIIFPASMKLDDVNEKINNTVIFHDEKGRFEIFSKTVPTKDKPRFLNCRVKGDNFCPCFMKFENAIHCNYLYKVRMDNNRLFEYWDEQMKNNADIIRPRDILYWDNIEGFFDFLQIYVLTSPYSEYCDKYKTCLDAYYDNKTAIMFWKQNQLEYQRIIYDFFNSFNTKLNYDKLNKLYTRIKKYIEARALLMTDEESYKVITELFTVLGRLCNMINNQFNPEVMFIADKMQDLLEQLDQGTLKDPEDLRKLGYAIYCCSYADDLDVNPAFPFVFAPGAFLGDVHKGILETPKQFSELIKQFKKSMKMIKKTNDETVDLITNAIETNADNRDIVIRNTFDAYLSDRKMDKLKKNKELYEKMLGDILEKINLSDEIRGDITRNIISNIIAGEKVKDITFEDDEDGDLYSIFKEVINKYNNGIKEINDENKQKLNELQKKKNDLEKEINKEKDKINQNNEQIIEGEEEEEKEEEEKEEEEKEEEIKKKKKKKKKDKAKPKSVEKGEFQGEFQSGVDNKTKKFTDPNYRAQHMAEFMSSYGNKGIPSNVYIPKNKGPMSVRSTRSKMGMNKLDVVNKITKPSEIYKKLVDVNKNRSVNDLITENKEPMSEDLKGRLKAWYLIAIKNNGLDQMINKTIFDVGRMINSYKDFRDVLLDYPVKYDELLDQAFDNDKFKLLEALNTLNKTGFAEEYKIESKEDTVNEKKKILEDMSAELQKK